MDMQTRKLNAIEYLIGIQDEEVLKKIEQTISKSKVAKEKEYKPFTQKELVLRASESNKDYKAGRVKTQQQLEEESENW